MYLNFQNLPAWLYLMVLANEVLKTDLQLLRSSHVNTEVCLFVCLFHFSILDLRLLEP